MRSSRTIDLKAGRVEMMHGAGGRLMGDLIAAVFRPHLSNPLLDAGDDQAQFTPPPGRLAMTTDTYVISPLVFPGGDIGSLAIHGTVNDIAMAGAKPLHLTAGFVLEEGFPLAELEKIAASMGAAAKAAGVAIVSADTKVVERGACDGVYINTAGMGVIPDGVTISSAAARPGDQVILSGALGDHGVAIMAHRSGLEFETAIRSDSAALNGLVAAMTAVAPAGLRVLRDPTRGGLSASLNEIAHASGVGFRIDENAIPLKAEVQGACELLGLDPMNIANEGKLVAIVAAEAAEAVLAAMRAEPTGADAALIGEVVVDPQKLVRMTTKIGGERVVDWLAGEQLPRIC